jgi:hypothetical protein
MEVSARESIYSLQVERQSTKYRTRHDSRSDGDSESVTPARRVSSAAGCEIFLRSSVPDGTCNRRKHVVGVRPNQTNRAHHNHQHHGKHDRVFGDVLSLFIGPQLMQKSCHGLLLTPRSSTPHTSERKLLTWLIVGRDIPDIIYSPNASYGVNAGQWPFSVRRWHKGAMALRQWVLAAGIG